MQWKSNAYPSAEMQKMGGEMREESSWSSWVQAGPQVAKEDVVVKVLRTHRINSSTVAVAAGTGTAAGIWLCKAAKAIGLGRGIRSVVAR